MPGSNMLDLSKMVNQVAANAPPPEHSDPNYIRGEDIAKFRELTGRDPSEQERAWFQSTEGIKQEGSARAALENRARWLNGIGRKVQNMATAAGLEMPIEEALGLMNRYVIGDFPSDSEINEALSLASVEVGNRAQKKMIKDLFPQSGDVPGGNTGTGSDAGSGGVPGIGGNKPTPITDDHRARARQVVTDLGLPINEREIEFLAGHLAGGESDYEIEQFLMTTPQYLKIQSDAEQARLKAEAEAEREMVRQESGAARQALDIELQRSGDEAFKRAQPEIISSFMRAGRLNSSGLENALARARGDIERDRQTYMGGLGYEDAIRAQGYGRQDFVNRNSQAWADYARRNDIGFQSYLRQSEPGYQQRFARNELGNRQIMAGQDAANYMRYQFPLSQLSRLYGMQDQRMQRGYDLEDYGMQRNDYFNALNQQYRQQERLLPYQLGGQLLGAGIQGLAMRGFKF